MAGGEEHVAVEAKLFRRQQLAVDLSPRQQGHYVLPITPAPLQSELRAIADEVHGRDLARLKR